jgi:hypothetical protein
MLAGAQDLVMARSPQSSVDEHLPAVVVPLSHLADASAQRLAPGPNRAFSGAAELPSDDQGPTAGGKPEEDSDRHRKGSRAAQRQDRGDPADQQRDAADRPQRAIWRMGLSDHECGSCYEKGDSEC